MFTRNVCIAYTASDLQLETSNGISFAYAKKFISVSTPSQRRLHFKTLGITNRQFSGTKSKKNESHLNHRSSNFLSRKFTIIYDLQYFLLLAS